MKFLKIIFFAAVLAGFSATFTFAQKARPKPAAKVKPIIFAVISDGGTVEPVAYVDNGKLVQPVSGGEEEAKLILFNKNYYKAKAAYRLIFGGSNAGTVTIKSSDPKSECSANMAAVATVTTRSKLKGDKRRCDKEGKRCSQTADLCGENRDRSVGSC
jgi:hypothetical protein